MRARATEGVAIEPAPPTLGHRPNREAWVGVWTSSIAARPPRSGRGAEGRPGPPDPRCDRESPPPARALRVARSRVSARPLETRITLIPAPRPAPPPARAGRTPHRSPDRGSERTRGRPAWRPTAGLMSTHTVRVRAGSRLPVAMAWSMEAHMMQRSTPARATRIRRRASTMSVTTSGAGRRHEPIRPARIRHRCRCIRTSRHAGASGLHAARMPPTARTRLTVRMCNSWPDSMAAPSRGRSERGAEELGLDVVGGEAVAREKHWT